MKELLKKSGYDVDKQKQLQEGELEINDVDTSLISDALTDLIGEMDQCEIEEGDRDNFDANANLEIKKVNSPDREKVKVTTAANSLVGKTIKVSKVQNQLGLDIGDTHSLGTEEFDDNPVDKYISKRRRESTIRRGEEILKNIGALDSNGFLADSHMSPVKERHENVEESKSSVERHENVEQLKLLNEGHDKASIVEELFDEKECDEESALSKMKLVEKGVVSQDCIVRGIGAVGVSDEEEKKKEIVIGQDYSEKDAGKNEGKEENDSNSSIKLLEGEAAQRKATKSKDIGGFVCTKEVRKVTVFEALKYTKGKYSHPHDTIPFSHRQVMGVADCTVCNSHCQYSHVCIREELYYNMYLQNRDRWFHVNTCSLAIAFIYHSHHNKKIQIVDSYINKDRWEILPETESIISIMWKNSHYGVCEFVLKGRKLNLYDGMYHNSYFWKTVTQPLEKKIDLALIKRKDYVPKMTKSRKIKKPKKFESQLRKIKWGVRIHQTDIVNCGPIAIMVMWGLIVEDDAVKLEEFLKIFSKSVLGFRDVIVEKIKVFFQEYDRYWYVCEHAIVMREKDIRGHGEVNVEEQEHLEKKFITDDNRKVEMETESLCRQCGTMLNPNITGTVRVQPCGHRFCNFCWVGYRKKECCYFCTNPITSISKDTSETKRQRLSSQNSKVNSEVTKPTTFAEVNVVRDDDSTKATDAVVVKETSEPAGMGNSEVSYNNSTVTSAILQQYMHTRILTNENNNRIRLEIQNKQSEVMKERYSLLVPSARVGDYVSIAVPKQDRVPGTNYNAIAVIYKIRFRSKTIVAVTEMGIISKKGRSGEDNYNSFSPGDFITLHQEIHYPNLVHVRTMCINGDREGIESLGKITLRELYRRKYDYRDKSLLTTMNTSERKEKKRSCVCSGGNCSNRCGCKKSGTRCNNSCSCRGKCK